MNEKENKISLNEILKSDQEDSVVKDESINTEEESELSQEVKNIFEALDEYVEKYNGNAFFHVGLGAFDESGEVVDDRLGTYGSDDVIRISMEDILEELKQQPTSLKPLTSNWPSKQSLKTLRSNAISSRNSTR